MNQKHLLKFIKRKLRECGNEEVIIRDGAVLTLKQVFESLNFKESFQLSVDTLDLPYILTLYSAYWYLLTSKSWKSSLVNSAKYRPFS